MSFSNTTKLVENFKRRKAVRQAPVNWLAEKTSTCLAELKVFQLPWSRQIFLFLLLKRERAANMRRAVVQREKAPQLVFAALQIIFVKNKQKPPGPAGWEKQYFSQLLFCSPPPFPPLPFKINRMESRTV